MSYNEKKKIPYKVIISVLIAMLILGTLIAFNFTRIRLMTKGYGWSEQSIILQLNDNEIERYLDAEKVSDLSSWNEYKNKKKNNYKNILILSIRIIIKISRI